MNCTSYLPALDHYYEKLFTCLLQSARTCIPHSSGHPFDVARNLKTKANFWHRVWSEAGYPSVGVLFQIKCKSKAKFKYEVRRLKRRQLFLRRQKMADALASSLCNFWGEVKRINRNPSSCGSVSTLDGISAQDNIANLWSNKLLSLLNLSDNVSCDALTNSLSDSLSSSDLESIQFSPECIFQAICNLKLSKSDGSGLSSDHLVHAAPVISNTLADLCTAIIRHGHMPEALSNCILVPIPIDQKDPTKSDNYRPVDLTPTLSKVIEQAIKLQYSEFFFTCDLQFGFKKGFSTSLCTGILKNTVSRYILRRVYSFWLFS